MVERLAAGPAREIHASDLPVGIRPRRARSSAGHRGSLAEELLAAMRTSGASFWASVYPLFMRREITRADLRDVVRRAKTVSNGDTNDLLRVLNMPPSDRQKFTRFLRKYGCELAV